MINWFYFYFCQIFWIEGYTLRTINKRKKLDKILSSEVEVSLIKDYIILILNEVVINHTSIWSNIPNSKIIIEDWNGIH